MKRLFLVLLAVAALNSSSLILSPLAQAGEDVKIPHVVAYYFHGSFRCSTCHKLEQYSKEAIETNFKDDIVSGKLEFNVVNVEAKGNEHFVNDYQLYTKSLVISLVKDDKEIKFKNLEKIWEYAGDKKRFVGYVKEEISNFLKEL